MNLETALPPSERAEEILTPSALDFVSELHGRFDARRLELLSARETRGAPGAFSRRQATFASPTGRSRP